MNDLIKILKDNFSCTQSGNVVIIETINFGKIKVNKDRDHIKLVDQNVSFGCAEKWMRSNLIGEDVK